MTLQDIYDQLAFGELRQLSLGKGIDATSEEIQPEDFKRLLPSIQLGLTELHKRFNLREGNLTIELVPGRTTYVIHKKFTESGTSAEPVKYILDADAPFENNLMKIERIYGRYLDREYEIPLNRVGDGRAIRTTSFNTLVVPDDTEKAPWLLETTELKLVYRADHPEINKYLANGAPLATEIFLPATYLEALLYYVASRLHNPIGMDPGAMHEGNNYYAKFIAACQELEDQNLEIDEDSQNDKLRDRGFP